MSVGTALTDTQRRQPGAVVDYMRPAHTDFVDLLEPGAPASFDHWGLGISELVVSTNLH